LQNEPVLVKIESEHVNLALVILTGLSAAISDKPASNVISSC